jgi:hypothetical protein
MEDHANTYNRTVSTDQNDGYQNDGIASAVLQSGRSNAQPSMQQLQQEPLHLSSRIGQPPTRLEPVAEADAEAETNLQDYMMEWADEDLYSLLDVTLGHQDDLLQI